MSVPMSMMLKTVILLSLLSLVVGSRFMSLESIEHEHRFIRHREGKAYVIKIKSDAEKEDTEGKQGRQASTFKIIPGLAAPTTKNAISFESLDRPGYYFRQDEDKSIVLSKFDDSRSFIESATFFKKRSNAFPKRPHFVSFQSFLHKDNFIMEKDFKLLVGSGSGPQFKKDTTFKTVAPNWAD